MTLEDLRLPDRSAALKALHGSEEHLEKVVEEFCAEAPKTLHRVANLLMHRETNRSRYEIRKLRCQSSVFFSQSTSDLLASYEQQLRDDSSAGDVFDQFHDVSKHVTELIRQLKKWYGEDGGFGGN